MGRNKAEQQEEALALVANGGGCRRCLNNQQKKMVHHHRRWRHSVCGVMYSFVVSLTNIPSTTIAASSSSPAVLSVGFHYHRPKRIPPPSFVSAHQHNSFSSSSRLYGMTEEDDNIMDMEVNKYRRKQRVSIKRTTGSSGEKKKTLSKNTRVKMKKVHTTSCNSKLLVPPSILPSPHPLDGGRQWASSEGDERRITIPLQKKKKKFGGGTAAKFRRGLLKEDNGESPTQKNRDSLGGDESKSNNALITDDKSLSSIPSFSSASNDSRKEVESARPSTPVIEGVLPVSELFYHSSSTAPLVNSSTTSNNGDSVPINGNVKNGAEQSSSLLTPGNRQLMLSEFGIGIGIGIDEGGDDDQFQSEVVQQELRAMAAQEQEEQRRLDLHLQLQSQMAESSSLEENNINPTRSPKGSAPNKGGSAVASSNKKNSKKDNKPKLKPDRINGTGRKMVRRGMEMLVGGEPINADPPQRSIELCYYRKHPKLWSRAISTNSPYFGPLLHNDSAGKVGRTSVGLFCENFVDVAQKWDICPDDIMSNLEYLEQASDSFGGIPIVSEQDMDALIETITLPEDSTDEGASKAVVMNSERVALGGQLKFSLNVSHTELECGDGSAFRRALRESIGISINSESIGFDVEIAELSMVAASDGDSTTDVTVEFQLLPRETMGGDAAKKAAEEVNGSLANALNNGQMAMALAQSVKEESSGWSADVRNRIVEELSFETEANGEENGLDITNSMDRGLKTSGNLLEDTYDGPFGMSGDILHSKDDIWLGGGNGGVFFDYSESNFANSPFKGKLGPRLVDAAVERAKQNQPRVIAIGDVHGCIDELKALLKKCDYHPGDVVVFLGDLVCKGPDSLSVVQLAREVGALGVRGNHDFEVVRWHQAIKSGADPPVIGSEHYYVASALSTADLKWLYSLPWYISSSHLNALFVHAGLVSGIQLAKQNPRLMMNMRSILPDGTVTSKFFNNWPWARLWDGPQTVFFGHDADRGLQQYEHAIGLDTGCVYGGKLTACILPERRLVSVNAKREYFQYRRKHFD